MVEPIESATPTPEPAPVETPEVVEEPTILGKEETPEAKPDSEVSKEEKPVEKVIPEKYDVKVPEGMTLDVATLELFSPIFKELGITNEGAQKLVDVYAPLISSSADKIREENLRQFSDMVKEWSKESLTELGAESKQKLAMCGKALQKFGTPELREMLNQTGVGSHKELVKFMAKVGATISEDSFVDTPGQPHELSEADRLKKMYPSMSK